MWFIGVEVEQETSAPPPKKNPGSAPVNGITEVKMADYQENVSSCLPFYDLTDREFHAMVGSWPDRRHDLDLYDLLPNPNKFDECDPDLMLNTPCSEYYSVRSFNKMLVNSDAKSFSILHCNIRSLSKNLNLLEELLCSLDSKLGIH